jgi:seryl-tRNA(Sec) selenium transferase
LNPASGELSTEPAFSCTPVWDALRPDKLPLEEFPSAALVLRVKGLTAAQLAARLRQGDPPIIGYIHKNDVYLDMKAVMDEELDELASVVMKAMTYDK